jgi:hypothetical protein
LLTSRCADLIITEMDPKQNEPPYREINEVIVRASQASDPPVSRRRRVPRQSTSWFGHYRLGDDPEWADCEVVDVSVIGIGACINAGGSEAEVGQHITIEVRAAAGGSVSLQLLGEIRHAQRMADGRLRIGAEFSGLSETECAILDALEHMAIAW